MEVKIKHLVILQEKIGLMKLPHPQYYGCFAANLAEEQKQKTLDLTLLRVLKADIYNYRKLLILR